jgi:predicted O-linked N-acetylglucosamine transferase (SPINDLY family)
MLEVLDLPELIAKDREDYIAISTRLLKDQDFYAEMKMLIAQRKDRLFHDQSVATAFKQAVRPMVRRHLPAPGLGETLPLYGPETSSSAAA